MPKTRVLVSVPGSPLRPHRFVDHLRWTIAWGARGPGVVVWSIPDRKCRAVFELNHSPPSHLSFPDLLDRFPLPGRAPPSLHHCSRALTPVGRAAGDFFAYFMCGTLCSVSADRLAPIVRISFSVPFSHLFSALP